MNGTVEINGTNNRLKVDGGKRTNQTFLIYRNVTQSVASLKEGHHMTQRSCDDKQ